MIPLLIWKSFWVFIYGIFKIFKKKGNLPKYSKAQDPKTFAGQTSNSMDHVASTMPAGMTLLTFRQALIKLVYHQPTTSLHVWKACDPLTDHAFLSVTPTCSLSPHSPQRNVALNKEDSIGRARSDWGNSWRLKMGLEYDRTVSKHQERHATKPSYVHPPFSFCEPNPHLLFFSPFVAFVVAPSVCVSAFLFAGEPRFGCIFGQQLASAVAFSNTGHFFFLYQVPEGWKILKERPKPSCEIRLLDIYICCFAY